MRLDPVKVRLGDGSFLTTIVADERRAHMTAMQALSGMTATARGWTARMWQGPGGGRDAALALLRQGFDCAYGRAIGGLPGLEGAEELAARYAERHGDADRAVNALIKWQSGAAAGAGFVTGISGFVSLPVALPANIAGALYIQARLIAAIAHLHGHDIRSNEVRMLALACLTGSKAAGTMKDAGVRFGTRLARDGFGWVSPFLLRKAAHAANAPAVCVAGTTAARAGRLVPVVGGVVAGGFDAAMTALIGRTADRVFRQHKAQQNRQQNRGRDSFVRT